MRNGAAFATYKFTDDDKKKSLTEAIETYNGGDKWKAIALIPYLEVGVEDLPLLASFIDENINEFLVRKNSFSTFMRKLVCFYDWKKYGWRQ